MHSHEVRKLCHQYRGAVQPDLHTVRVWRTFVVVSITLAGVFVFAKLLEITPQATAQTVVAPSTVESPVLTTNEVKSFDFDLQRSCCDPLAPEIK